MDYEDGFSFGIISYNQENFILEHLESIKYQIRNYFVNYKINLIISDDASSDNTIKYAIKWLESNKELFHNFKIFVNDKNEGIVANYHNCLEKIFTRWHKILAADDLYNYLNIFDVVKKADFIITNPLNLSDKKIESTFFNRSIYSSRKKILKKIKKGNIFSAPGIFLSSKLNKDKYLNTYRNKFKMIEDYPTWFYLFSIYNDKFSINISCKNYVIYRLNFGYSTDRQFNDSYYEEFLKTLKIMGLEEKKHNIEFIKYINPYKYYLKFKILLFNLSKIMNNKDSVLKAQAHYNYIHQINNILLNSFSSLD